MKIQILSFLILLSTGLFAQNTYTTFFEDFDNNDGDWWVGYKKDVTGEVVSGFYTYENLEKKRNRITYKEVLVSRDADFTFETSIQLLSGKKDQGFGLVVGFESWDNYARVLITEGGSVSIGYKINKKWTNVMQWTKVKAGIIKNKGASNHFKLEQKGSKIVLYINGAVVYQGNKSVFKFVGRKHGFFTSSKQKLKIDYLRIKHLDKPINVVQNATTSDKIENLGPSINTKYMEQGPVLSADGRTMYFTIKNHPSQYVGTNKNTDIAYSKLDPNGNWSDRQLLPHPINNKSKNFLVSILPDENTVLLGNAYYADGSMGKGVSQAVRRNGQWQTPTPLRIRNLVNNNNYVNYFLSADGGHLFLAIEPSDSKGSLDLYISKKEANGTWSQPKNLGPQLNTFADDFSPFLAADGKTLFFASKGHPGYGSADIFMSKRLDETWMNWAEPVNLGPGINTDKWDAYFKIDSRGEYGYMVSSGKDSYGDSDIFRIKLGEGAQPDALELVSGKVYDAKTNQLLDAEIIYEDLHSGMQMGTAYSTQQDGFKIVLPRGYKYGFQAKVAGYMPVADNLDLTDLNNYKEKTVDLYMVPIEQGQDFTLKNIFFDGSTANLSAESYLELDRLVQMMKSNPNINIEIHSNMINGGLQSNQLSVLQDRITAIQNYITQKQVNINRVKMEMGEIKFKPSLNINQNGEIRIKLF